MAPAPPPEASAERADQRRAVLVALTANVAVAIAKLIAFLASGSSAMVAESLHHRLIPVSQRRATGLDGELGYRIRRMTFGHRTDGPSGATFRYPPGVFVCSECLSARSGGRSF
jgi:hypothetical protein